jgi:ABC-type glycerol-3-phosphate transport system substrate-binding protein
MYPKPLHRKFVALIAVLVAGSAVITGCSGSSDAEKTADGKTVVRYQGSASQVTFPELGG